MAHIIVVFFILYPLSKNNHVNLISQKAEKEFIRNQGAAFFKFVYIKQHTNGRNVVGQQLQRLLDVHAAASVCTPCCMLLRIVGSCYAKFETGQTFQPTTPNISYVP